MKRKIGNPWNAKDPRRTVDAAPAERDAQPARDRAQAEQHGKLKRRQKS